METLELERLNGYKHLTPSAGGFMAESATICLEANGHVNTVSLRVAGAHDASILLQCLSPTEPMRCTHNDHEEATEWGAYGIGLLLMEHFAGLQFASRSRKGTGFDYWLAPQDQEPNSLEPWKNTVRLEVSGILKGTESDIRKRVRVKENQVKVSDGLLLPSYVVVVEFSRPIAQVTNCRSAAVVKTK